MRVWQLMIVMMIIPVIAICLTWPYIDVEGMEDVMPFGVELDPNNPALEQEPYFNGE